MSEHSAEMVHAANALTAAWVSRLHLDDNIVLSGAGAWGLLAMLLVGADGDARRELEAAMHTAHDDAAELLSQLVRSVGAASGVEAAIGIWTHPDVEVLDSFRSSLRGLTVDPIPARSAGLDEWARAKTSGMITRFPAAVPPQARLVAASALASAGDWLVPFSPILGRWASEPQWIDWLYRRSSDLDSVALIRHGSVTVSRAVCETEAGFDVHLVAGGPAAEPSDVLHVALEAIAGRAEVVHGSLLRPGDGGGSLTVEDAPAFVPGPHVVVGLPVFEVEATHDLLENPAAFGLRAAMDRSTGHFPSMSTFPLAIESAAQSVFAGFTATGFRAAAVTAAFAVAGGGPRYTATILRASFDRPFGFVVVERITGLVLFLGWIAQPRSSLSQIDPISARSD